MKRNQVVSHLIISALRARFNNLSVWSNDTNNIERCWTNERKKRKKCVVDRKYPVKMVKWALPKLLVARNLIYYLQRYVFLLLLFVSFSLLVHFCRMFGVSMASTTLPTAAPPKSNDIFVIKNEFFSIQRRVPCISMWIGTCVSFDTRINWQSCTGWTRQSETCVYTFSGVKCVKCVNKMSRRFGVIEKL